MKGISRTKRFKRDYKSLSKSVPDLGKTLGAVVDMLARGGALPEKYREVIVMRHSQDMPYYEIAQQLGVPVGTVKARIFRARELLKKQLRTPREKSMLLLLGSGTFRGTSLLTAPPSTLLLALGKTMRSNVH